MNMNVTRTVPVALRNSVNIGRVLGIRMPGIRMPGIRVLGIGLLLGIGLAGAGPVRAHCDTLDGPVVTDARAALESGEIAPVLKWIRAEAEPEIEQAFRQAKTVRAQSPEARALADMYFFETLVRVHRAGEGAPYTGLKPAGSEVDPGITAADQALVSGTVDPVARDLSGRVDAGVRELFEKAHGAALHKEHNAEAGREYVEAYVRFIHYVEGLQHAAVAVSHHEMGEAQATARPEVPGGACSKHQN